MQDLQTYAQLRQDFREDILPAVIEQYGQSDDVAISEEWNNYTDNEAKNGALTDLEYHHCPSIDETGNSNWPDDDAGMLEYILQEMGVTVSAQWIRERPDNFMQDGQPMIHYLYSVSRNGRGYLTGHFSMGIAHHPDFRFRTGYTNALKEALETGRRCPQPSAADVMGSLLMDCGYELDDFEDWCGELGFDEDSRTAERIYKEVKRKRLALLEMVGNTTDLEQLTDRAHQL